ncbi:hypothetical protein [Mesorhizobium sp.]|uniref:hypothetical protein n=1 Tax=Mesorhizobium sp. TaxID=1871066 RepID=UPI000FE4854A|nr:hypothetical protein [Mesorhizobium sp.]RWE60623.1 MAG: hypothetical protein EOS67_02380 [Mesorhizobium sp.]
MTAKAEVLPKPDSANQAEPSRLLKIKGSTVTIDHTAAQKAFGSSDEDFINGFLRQLVNVGSHGKTPDDQGTAYHNAQQCRFSGGEDGALILPVKE